MDNDTALGDEPAPDLSSHRLTEATALPPRQQLALEWLGKVLADDDFILKPASADASFRSYWRVLHHGQSLILMDAPPPHEDCRPFVQVAQILAAAGVHVPAIHAQNTDDGFLLLEDFGQRDYLKALTEAEQQATENTRIDALYGDAMDALLRMQTRAETSALPRYDRDRLNTEMALFGDWFLGRHLGVELDEAQRAVLADAFNVLADNALEQPQVFVHRDYHSRNLMVVKDNNPGVLDFQDAVAGPVTYDLVSLLRDCYIKWPAERVQAWSEDYRQRWQAASGQSVTSAQWQRWFDLMGAQRHLKAVGIFCRLNYRDGKKNYLKDIPRTLGYLYDLSESYPELRPLMALTDACRPRVEQRCAH